MEIEMPGTSNKIKVMDPRGYPPKMMPKAMAPRLDGLDGKTIYLVDERFDDAGLLLEQVRLWFAEHMPSVKAKVVEISGNYGSVGDDFWQDLKEHADAAIVGVGH